MRPADSPTCPKCGAPVKWCRTKDRGEFTGALETEWQCGTWVEFDTDWPRDRAVGPPLRGAMHRHAQCRLNAVIFECELPASDVGELAVFAKNILEIAKS